MTTRSRGLLVAVPTALVLLLGWAWGDAADVVPGPLTAAPPPSPPASAPPAVPVEVPQLLRDDGAGPGAGGPAADAAPVDGVGLAAALAPLLADPALGPAPALSVRDLTTGAEVVQVGSAGAHEPASTVKLLTAAAALRVLGAERRLPTTVGWRPGSSRPSGRPAVVLVGGGDLLLAAGTGDADATRGRVGLGDLARQAVAAAEAPGAAGLLAGTATVDVVVDDALLGGPAVGRGPVDSLYASPPSSLAVDAGRVAGATAQDVDPATTAGTLFAGALGQAMQEALGAQAPALGAVEVSRQPVPVEVVLARGASAPVSDVLALLLATSDNTLADAVAGLVAVRQGQGPAMPAAAGAVVEVVERDLGVDLGPTDLRDGSGLVDGSRSSAAALSGLLAAAAAAPGTDDLRLLPSLLPVAGLEGTLAERFTAGQGSVAGRGVVRAKTGTLTGTVGLAGVGTTLGGRGVSFALLSDQVPAGGTDAARAAADRVAAAVVGCC